MIGLIKAEFRKLFTTQVWFWMLFLSLGLSALATVGGIAGNGNDESLQPHIREIFTAPIQIPAYIPLFILGVLSVTAEYRYQTITPTVLTTPSRWTLITAKMLSMALIGGLYALACLVVELGIALPWLDSRTVTVNFGGQLGSIAAVFVVLVLYSLVGLGVGALLKNQIVAVSVGLAFILIIDPIVLIIPGVKHVYPYTLSGGTEALRLSAHDDRSLNNIHVLAVGGGIAVIIIWALVTALVGAGLTMNRDIT